MNLQIVRESMNPQVVRWMNADTGEIKELHRTGVDRDTCPNGDVHEYEWEQSSLEMALALVPDLALAIELACRASTNVTVTVRTDGRG